MDHKSRLFLIPLAIASSIGVPAELAAAPVARFQYSAAFICGVDPPGVVPRVLPGQYATAINIHNASGRIAGVELRVAMTFPAVDPPGSQLEPGAVSAPLKRTLQPNEALMVDCQELPSAFEFREPLLAPPYLKGLLEVLSDRSLEVTAVYTAGAAGAGADIVESIAVEQIDERRFLAIFPSLED